MKKRREINIFSLSFLDLLSGALGAVIILYVAIPKNNLKIEQLEEKQKNIELIAENESLKDKLKEQEISLQEIKKKIEELESKEETIQVVESTPEEAKSPLDGNEENLDVGFKFKGKKVIFLIDTSLSMVDEDRMGQVKAGLKMLLTSMASEFEIEFVQFPFAQRAPFKTLWGRTMTSSKFNKVDAFEFLYRLKPTGATPTRDVLLFVLKNYEDISDIVLLTDGVPTLHNSNKKDDIYDILSAVRELNSKKVQINTIGVGTNFLSDKESDQYKFLSLLATETGGFFVGF
jgi:Mg-chelatase subunit ChlD